MKTIKITSENAGQRIDKVIRKYLQTAPLSFIYKLFRKKDIKVNGKRVDINYIVVDGDEISIYLKEEILASFSKINEKIRGKPFPYPIVYEDENVLIVDKPRGIIVNNPENSRVKTLQQEVISYLVYKNEFAFTEGGYIPEPAHRIDRNTSGLVIFAKTLIALQDLMGLFQEKTQLDKYYLVLVSGVLKDDGEINLTLKKDSKKGFVSVSKDGHLTKSKYIVEEVFSKYSLLQFQLITGFTHQIRVHCQAIHHPVIGDQKYGDFAINLDFKNRFGYENQFLHAYKLVFKKMPPSLKNLENSVFVSPLNEKEVKILSCLK